MLGFAAGTPVAGRYLLVERLAASPGAQIWSAFDDVLGRPVAVKFFPLAAGDQQSLIALRARARAAARVSHPHLVGVLDVGEAFTVDGAPTPFVVLALVEGEQLTDHLMAVDGLSPQEAAQVGAQIGSALGALHRRGLTHGEVDAANIMLTSSGTMLLGPVSSVQLGWDTRAASEADDVRALGALVEACADTTPPPLAKVCERAAVGGESAAELAAAFAALATPSAALHTTPLRAKPASRRRVGMAAAGLAGAVVAAGVGGVTAGALPSLLPTGGQPSGSAGGASEANPTVSPAPSSSAGLGTPKPTGSPTTAVPSGSVSPGSAGAPGASATRSADPAVVKTALGQLRDSVTAGRSLGEITKNVAQSLDAQIADMMIDVTMGRKIKGKLTALLKRVDLGEAAGDITAERAAAIRAAADDVSRADEGTRPDQ
jgi:eukaryotic-like serine/threonine-protein kinase